MMNYLKEELKANDVKKIICLGDYEDVDEQYDLLGKQTVYVVADSAL